MGRAEQSEAGGEVNQQNSQSFPEITKGAEGTEEDMEFLNGVSSAPGVLAIHHHCPKTQVHSYEVVV